MKHVSIRAIAAGCLVDWAGTALFGLLFGIIVSFRASGHGISSAESQRILQEWLQTLPGILFSVLFGLAFTCLGGYVAARLAKTDTLLNSAFVGSLGIIAGLFFMGSSPMIVNIISILLMIPVAVLGGFFHLKRWKLY